MNENEKSPEVSPSEETPATSMTVEAPLEENAQRAETEDERKKREEDAILTAKAMEALNANIQKAKDMFSNRIAFLKDFRADCRAIENAIYALTTGTSSIPVMQSLYPAKERMVEARMWAGKMLGTIGEVNPYKDANGEDKKELVPTQDPATSKVDFIEGNTITQNIQELRKMVEHLSTKFKSELPITRTEAEAWQGTYVEQKLSEARMWLGEALAA